MGKQENNLTRGLAHTAVVAAVATGLTWAVATYEPEAQSSHALSSSVGGTFDHWTSPGSTGAVDEKDLDFFKAKSGQMLIGRNAPSAVKLNVRYNVTWSTRLIANTNDTFIMQVRYRDTGDADRVRLKLKEYDLDTGEVTVRAIFDSDDVLPAAGYQLATIQDNDPDFNFNFADNVYFIDAVIIRSDESGKPGLAGITVFSQNL